MKVIVVKKTVETENPIDKAAEFVKNMRHTTEDYLTEEDIMNSAQFNKARAIRTVIMNLMNLHPVNTDNENHIDKETFDKYVKAAEQIDVCFNNMIDEFIINNEYECCDDCDGVCGNHECCDDCDESDDKCMCEDCVTEVCMDDVFNLVKIFKPAFNIDNVTENDKEITITMTGKEYLEIKEILDQYEIDDDSDC